MKIMKTMNLQTRLLLSFGAVLMLTLLLAGWSGWQLRALRLNTDELGDNWLPSVVTSSKMNAALSDLRMSYLRLALAHDDSEQAKFSTELGENRRQFERALTAYLPLVSSAQERKLADELQQAVTPYFQIDAQLQKLVGAGQAHAAQELTTTSLFEQGLKLRMLVEQITKLNEEGAYQEHRAAKTTYERSMLSIAIVATLALVLGLGLARRIAVDLGMRIGHASRAADSFASGDLTYHVEANGNDEVALMLQALARMQRQLVGLVSGVRENAESLATASAEISQGNADLSQRTEEQASALQQTAASMEQINGTAQSNADSAAQASQLSTQASDVAAHGSQIVSDVVNTMREIEQASRQMEEIIGVIDGIAFQTNILALNAAVEAARAGEQGRGFAVVASEVRSLAQRSAEAARQVKTLINQSAERVEAGSSLVNKAGNTMLEVTVSVRRVSDIVGEIAAGSREQMSGVAQISEAIGQMDQTTQQNAALVEESAAAAESLRQQADTLVKAVAVFRTGAPTLEDGASTVFRGANARTGPGATSHGKSMSSQSFGHHGPAQAIVAHGGETSGVSNSWAAF